MGAARAFKQLDVTRAIRAAQAAGIPNPRVRICPGGVIEIEGAIEVAIEAPPLDQLDAEVAEWRRQQGY